MVLPFSMVLENKNSKIYIECHTEMIQVLEAYVESHLLTNLMIKS